MDSQSGSFLAGKKDGAGGPALFLLCLIVHFTTWGLFLFLFLRRDDNRGLTGWIDGVLVGNARNCFHDIRAGRAGNTGLNIKFPFAISK